MTEETPASPGITRGQDAGQVPRMGGGVQPRPSLFGSLWTAEDKKTLAEMARAGKLVREAALVLDRTENATRAMAWEIGVKFAPPPVEVFWTPERDAILTELWNGDVPTGGIGRRMGISKNSAIGRARRLALTPRKSPVPVAKPKPDPVAGKEFRGCLYMHGHPDEPEWYFCQEDRYIRPDGTESSYCPEHHARCTMKADHVKREPFVFERKRYEIEATK